jgi:uncharacterized membrane protein YphA (DoxX/SURF4 family)
MSPSANASGVALRVLSLSLGVFMLAMGFDKVSWFSNPSILADRFSEWLSSAPPYTRWYLEWVAIPGSALFARIIPAAEFAAGLALVFGAYVRVAAALTFLMVLNFHFAADVMLHWEYLINPYGLPVLGGLLTLALGAVRLPLTITR